MPNSVGGVARHPADRVFDRELGAVADPVEQEPGRERCVHDQADVRARVAEADGHPRVVEQFLDGVHALVQERVVEQRAALRFARDAHERLGNRLAVRVGLGRQRRRGVGRVVDGVVGAARTRRSSRAVACSPRPRRAARAAGVVVERGEPFGERQRLQRLPRRRAVEERAVLHAEQQPDAARGCLRTELAARGRFVVDELEDLAEQLGAGIALRETERHGPAGAPVDLGHPVHFGARAFVLVARTFEARRDFVHALAVPPEHIGDREQLALVGPRSRHGPAVGNTMQQRARRREAERAGCHRLVDEVAHDRDVVVGCGCFVEAALAHRVVAERAVADHAADVHALR